MIDIAVVRVFTDAEGRHGNALGIVQAEQVPLPERQALAADLGFSETVFVEPLTGRTATAQIFTPTLELPFAGHPTVGLAWWLRKQGNPVSALHVPAGEVRTDDDGDLTFVRADPDWAPRFTFHDCATAVEVEHLDPSDYGEGHHYAWAWQDQESGTIRSRMFAPLMCIAEDEATGAAACRITQRLGRGLSITQGRGSQLRTTLDDGWVTLGGRVVADTSLTRPSGAR